LASAGFSAGFGLEEQPANTAVIAIARRNRFIG